MATATRESDMALLVPPDAARRQLDAEARPPAPSVQPVSAGPAWPSANGGTPAVAGPATPAPAAGSAAPCKLRRIHGVVAMDSARVGRDASGFIALIR